MSSEEAHSEYVAEISDRLGKQLRERFPAFDELEERDQIAIGHAITKAAWDGFLGGVATHVEVVNQTWDERVAPTLRAHLPADFSLPDRPFSVQFVDPSSDDEDRVAFPDLWEERYGSEDE